MLKHTNMTPTDLSHQLGLTLKTICSTLRHMREVNLVRYETENKSKIYYLKDKLLLQVLESIEMYVNTMRAKKW
jgi:DNA-binding transcriptional regulator GbsR (MarR family)